MKILSISSVARNEMDIITSQNHEQNIIFLVISTDPQAQVRSTLRCSADMSFRYILDKKAIHCVTIMSSTIIIRNNI